LKLHVSTSRSSAFQRISRSPLFRLGNPLGAHCASLKYTFLDSGGLKFPTVPCRISSTARGVGIMKL